VSEYGHKKDQWLEHSTRVLCAICGTNCEVRELGMYFICKDCIDEMPEEIDE
jgi:hypothetical protein